MKVFIAIALIILAGGQVPGQPRALVFQSDFGLRDGAVSAMKGVAYSVSQDLDLFDITHDIPAYNIREAAIRLAQAAPFWPPGTVFVSVVDPGVGSARKSIVVKTGSGHYFVTPDNGTITFVAASMGIREVREIDEARNRLPASEGSHTFHGRDIYAYTGARLASGVISFEEAGPLLESRPVVLPEEKAMVANGAITGIVDVLDVQYGNVWTNIGAALLAELDIKPGEKVRVTLSNGGRTFFDGEIAFGRTFSDVPPGATLAYLNSLQKFSLAINQGNFARQFNIESGPGWQVVVAKAGTR